MASRRARGSWRLPLAILGACLVTSPPVSASDSGPRDWGDCFWGGGLVRDYARPLDRLPEVRQVPESGRLPFGPPALELYESTLSGRVIVGRGSFGYGFVTRRNDGVLTLGWTVRAEMHALNRRGEVERTVDRGQLWIESVNNLRQPGLSLMTPAATGFYRFDIEFESREGEMLGSFSEYLRVVEPRLRVSLGINGKRFRVGDIVQTRVNNIGTQAVLYGASFFVQRLEGAEWVSASGLDLGRWPMYLGVAGPGARGRCSGFQIPEDLPQGRYRVVKRVGVGPHWPRKGQSLHLNASFDVVG